MRANRSLMERRTGRLNLELFCHFPGNFRTCGHARAIAHFKRIVRLRKDQAMRPVTPTLRLQQASCEQDEKGVSWITSLHTDSQPMSVAYLEKLNPEQRRAVEHGVRENDAAPGTPLLVIAGAGVRQD